MYWRTYDPVTNLQVDEFEMYVYDYMDDDIYQAKYKDNKDGIKRYIMIGQLYEYYAFGYPLRRMGIEDPLGQDWLTLWVDDGFAQKLMSSRNMTKLTCVAVATDSVSA